MPNSKSKQKRKRMQRNIKSQQRTVRKKKAISTARAVKQSAKA